MRAKQHEGSGALDNVALACGYCNRHTGPNIAGIDPQTQQLTRLFRPRTDRWPQHFRWDGATIVGLTPIGRVTVGVLALNSPHSLSIRQTLMDEGVFGFR